MEDTVVVWMVLLQADTNRQVEDKQSDSKFQTKLLHPQEEWQYARTPQTVAGAPVSALREVEALQVEDEHGFIKNFVHLPKLPAEYKTHKIVRIEETLPF
ncbi:hypothetical protein HUJ05_001523 [Dendroctonus ponderosae]|nr:hypothetical protein HUJ05_001523 [Dendroctonus ponderosae]